MLEANPGLNWRDVQHIIVRTAKRANLKADDWRVNGAGYNLSHAFGFGLMDAGAMVRLAQTWETVPQHQRCESDWSEREVALAGRDRAELRQNVTCDNIRVMEHVHVTIDISHYNTR